MSQINPTRPKGATASSHLNYMGGPSWDVKNPVGRLRMMASSCFFGEPQYYSEGTPAPKRRVSRPTYGWDAYDRGLTEAQVKHLNDTLQSLEPYSWRGLSSKEKMEKAIDEALDYSVEETLKAAGDIRNEDLIRTTPQVIMVRAANHSKAKGTGLVQSYAPTIIKRADEPSVQLAYQLATYGKPIPNSLKKAWRAYMASASPYSLGKYKMESRTVKTVDVVNLVHPRSTPVDLLSKGTLTPPNTWEVRLSAAGSTPEAWAQAFEKDMGHMALLRNLRNLVTKSKVPQDAIARKLVEGVDDGKQLPFRYWSAFKAVEGHAKPVLLDAIEDCLRKSCANLAFPGRVMSLCDNSGSAWGALTSEWGSVHVAEIANLTAVLTAFASEHGEVGVFGDRLETFQVRKHQSVFDALKQANHLGSGVGGGTENGIWLFWDEAIRSGTHYDAVFVYSDMQAGHGGLYGTNPSAYRDYSWPGDGRYVDVPKLINKYRSTVNPNVEVFLVQVAGYQDTICPEWYNHTHILGGWSEGILRYAQRYLTGQ